jgi:hypothetical protein
MEDLTRKVIVVRRFVLAGVVLVAACRDRGAPPVELQPIARLTPDSTRTIEIIGLRRWSAGMLGDSLKKYAPGDPIESEATAANLRNLLGFADASTTTHSLVFDENEQAIVTIAVREPADSALVHYAPQSLDTVPKRKEWLPVATAFIADTTGKMDVQRRLEVVAGAWLEGPGHVVVDSTVKGKSVTHVEGFEYESPADSLAAKPWLDSLAAHRTDTDYNAALDAVNTSTSGPDRIMAALILSGFPERDEAWRSILKIAIGREQARDAFVAQRALSAMADRYSRPVDWKPVAPLIHDVLDGTALAALAPLARALVATGASPANASDYLGGGGEMLTAFVESDNPDVRDPAHDLLLKLSGTDLGFDPPAWRSWIAGLAAKKP